MTTIRKTYLLSVASRRLQAYLLTPGITGLFTQAWDRLNTAGLDVDLHREPSVENARALKWMAENTLAKLQE